MNLPQDQVSEKLSGRGLASSQTTPPVLPAWVRPLPAVAFSAEDGSLDMRHRLSRLFGRVGSGWVGLGRVGSGWGDEGWWWSGGRRSGWLSGRLEARLPRRQSGERVGEGAFRAVVAAAWRSKSRALELARNSPSILRQEA